MPVQRTGAGQQSRGATGYQQKKAARERLQAVRARVASFVQTVLEPGLRAISDELDWPLVQIRQMAHLALPAVVQQRRLSLWQAVMRVAREENSDWDSAISSAQRTYSELQDAIARADWDDPLLVEYEQLRSEMEQGRAIKRMPKTTQQTVRAKLSFVARCHQEMDEKLQIMCNAAGIEFLLVITTGDKAVKFAPFISATRKVLDFLPFKFKISADQFSTEMEGFSLFGSEAYTMLSSKDPKHKAEVSRLLTEQLRALTGQQKVTLRWKEDSIQANYDGLGVELLGWPADTTFRPLNLLSNSQARRLHLAVRAGTLRFERKSTSTPQQQPVAGAGAISAASRRQQAPPVRSHPDTQGASRPSTPGSTGRQTLSAPALRPQPALSAEREARASESRPPASRAAVQPEGSSSSRPAGAATSLSQTARPAVAPAHTPSAPSRAVPFVSPTPLPSMPPAPQYPSSFAPPSTPMNHAGAFSAENASMVAHFRGSQSNPGAASMDARWHASPSWHASLPTTPSRLHFPSSTLPHPYTARPPTTSTSYLPLQPVQYPTVPPTSHPDTP